MEQAGLVGLSGLKERRWSAGCHLHDVGDREIAAVELGHGLHIGGSVGEVGTVTGAEVVEHFFGRTRRLGIEDGITASRSVDVIGVGGGEEFAGGYDAVFGTFAMAESEPLASLTTRGERVALIGSKGAKPMTQNHGDERRVDDIAKPMVGVREMIAGEEIAVMFHDRRMTAGISENACTRW